MYYYCSSNHGSFPMAVGFGIVAIILMMAACVLACSAVTLLQLHSPGGSYRRAGNGSGCMADR